MHSGEGFEAQLVCIVYADPQPSVSARFNLSEREGGIAIKGFKKSLLNVYGQYYTAHYIKIENIKHMV